MKEGQIKNLSFSILVTVIIAYCALTNYTLIGAVSAAVCAGAVFLIGLLYRKEDGIAQKIDFYALFIALSVLALNYTALLDTFSLWGLEVRVRRGMDSTSLGITAVAMVLAFIFTRAAPKKDKFIVRHIMKSLSLFFFVCGVSNILLGVNTHVVKYAVICAASGLISWCKACIDAKPRAHKSTVRIAFLFCAVLMTSALLCPSLSLTEIVLTAQISKFLPWYIVLSAPLAALIITGANCFFSHKPAAIDADTVFLAGLAGMLWTTKSALYFRFDFFFIAIIIYTCVFCALFHRFTSRKPLEGVPMKNNEAAWCLIGAAIIALAVYLTSRGYLYFCLTAVLGALAICFVHRRYSGWQSKGAFWQCVLAALSACSAAFSLSRAYAPNKLWIIAASLIFASAAMWMMNHRADIGRNGFLRTKIAVSAAYALLMCLIAAKSGVAITITPDEFMSGTYYNSNGMLSVTAQARDINSSLETLRYVWSDSHLYDEEDVREVSKNYFASEIEGKHLIVWASNTDGVETRAERWFFDTDASASAGAHGVEDVPMQAKPAGQFDPQAGKSNLDSEE